jgi:phosphatidylglycerol:prolipoprotein diacylglycerol transferase
MSFHGGLVGVMVAMWLYGRKIGYSMLQVTDFVAPLVPLGLGFGRIGNFINGELWGKETTVPWGVLYQGRVLHPSQLYEALLEGFLLFALLWWYSSKPRPTMAVSGLFLIGYGIGRFIVEFYRVPDQHMGDGGYLLAWLTTGQLLTMPMILGGAVLMVFAYKRKGSA